MDTQRANIIRDAPGRRGPDRGSGRPGRARRPSHPAPCVEALEGRQLLSGGIRYQQGTVYIRGEGAQDVAMVLPSGESVAVVMSENSGTPVQRTFDARAVRAIRFVGGPGVNFYMNGSAVPTTAIGNGAVDLLASAAPYSRFRGGPGRNVIAAAGGHSTIVGGRGQTLALGRPGSDRILAAGPQTQFADINAILNPAPAANLGGTANPGGAANNPGGAAGGPYQPEGVGGPAFAPLDLGPAPDATPIVFPALPPVAAPDVGLGGGGPGLLNTDWGIFNAFNDYYETGISNPYPPPGDD